jgi:hypothetical protein
VTRLAPLLLCGALAATGCGGPGGSSQPEGSGPEASPRSTGNGETELIGASCKARGGGSAKNIPDFVDVEVERGDGVERVTFWFRPRGPAKQPPSHYVRFTKELTTGAEKPRPANIEGEAFLQVVFSAFSVEIEGEQPSPIYTGPTELRPRLSTVRELEQLGDFEATITWGIGLSRRACFLVDARPDRLTLEFPPS